MYAKSCCYSFHYQCDAFFLYASCGGITQLLAAIEHIRYRQMVAFGMSFQFQACIFDGGSRQDGDSNQGVFLDVSHATSVSLSLLWFPKRYSNDAFAGIILINPFSPNR